jgi:hypothetical protein
MGKEGSRFTPASIREALTKKGTLQANGFRQTQIDGRHLLMMPRQIILVPVSLGVETILAA